MPRAEHDGRARSGGRSLAVRAGTFDLVLIDAPCSGLGTIRRDPDIRWRRSPDDLPRFAAAQRELLARAADLVKPGGRLLYSTCSSEPEENEDVVAAFLGDRHDFTQERTTRRCPSATSLEAFFGSSSGERSQNVRRTEGASTTVERL